MWEGMGTGARLDKMVLRKTSSRPPSEGVVQPTLTIS
jgi:hypothetical protein